MTTDIPTHVEAVQAVDHLEGSVCGCEICAHDRSADLATLRAYLAAQSAPLRTVEQVAEALGVVDDDDSAFFFYLPDPWTEDDGVEESSLCEIRKTLLAKIVAASQSSAPPTEGHPDE